MQARSAPDHACRGNWLSVLLLAAAAAVTIDARAEPGPPAQAASSAAAASAPPAASPRTQHPMSAQHVEDYRRAHADRLIERISTPPEELHQRCRFESQISTLPPQGVVSLTFDDGPEPEHTEAILELLTKEKVPATFFLIAEKARRHTDLVARMRALPGAVIGNHSWSHPNFHDIPVPEQQQEIEKSDAILHPDLAAELLFRYPYGNSSCEGNDALRQRGYRIVGWHVDSCDWAFDGPEGLTPREALSCGVAAAYRQDFVGHVLSGVRAHRGGIVLLHETHRNAIEHLGEIIRRLKAEGYTFGTPADTGFASSLR